MLANPDPITSEMISVIDELPSIGYEEEAVEHLAKVHNVIIDLLYERSDGPQGTIHRDDLGTILQQTFNAGAKVGRFGKGYVTLHRRVREHG
jgi:hypothetical protein